MSENFNHLNHLLIGLGGTGGKILRAFRKIQERYLKHGEKPSETIKFLYMDTSDDELDKPTDYPKKWEVMGRDIRLEESDILLSKAGSILSILKNSGGYPNIKNWIEPKSVFSFVDAGTKGAAQRRKLGRLIFAQNIKNFHTRLANKVQFIEAITGKGLTFHVFAGLAGGTGSGFLVDVIAQIRKAYPDIDNYRIIVYAVLPEENTKRDVDGKGFYYANGYAALLELNALAVGKYNPFDINSEFGERILKQFDYEVEGNSIKHTYFNSCYLIDNENDRGKKFDIDTDVPNLTAEFLYQKIMHTGWNQLDKFEEGENGQDVTSEGDNLLVDIPGKEKPILKLIGGLTRSRLFMAFGIKRLIVPEEEILQKLIYGYATKICDQLLYNNFVTGRGYIDQDYDSSLIIEEDINENISDYQLTESHLILETAVLDSNKDKNWSMIAKYWHTVTTNVLSAVQKNKQFDKKDWHLKLSELIEGNYEKTYRGFIGVHDFYMKQEGIIDHIASSIVSHIEDRIFKKWQGKQYSLSRAHQLVLKLKAYLETKKVELNRKKEDTRNKQVQLNSAINNEKTKYTNIGIVGGLFGEHLKILNNIRSYYEELFILKTLEEGYNFSDKLIPIISTKIGELSADIESLKNKLSQVRSIFNQSCNICLSDQGVQSVGYDEKVYDSNEIDALLRYLYSENKETQQIDGTKILNEELLSFVQLSDGKNSFKDFVNVGVNFFCEKIGQRVRQMIQDRHEDILKKFPAAVGVNIVSRLQKKYGDVSKLRDQVDEWFRNAGVMLEINQDETTYQGGMRKTTVGTYIPKCPEEEDFHRKLKYLFNGHASKFVNPSEPVDTDEGNQIVIITADGNMPIRHAKTLGLLRQKYDHIINNAESKNGAELLHGEDFRPGFLPNLFPRSDEELRIIYYFKVKLLLAYCNDMIIKWHNPETNRPEWCFKYVKNNMPELRKIDDSEEFVTLFKRDYDFDLMKFVSDVVDKYLGGERFKLYKERQKIYDNCTEKVREFLDQEAGGDAGNRDYIMLRELYNEIPKLEKMNLNVED